MLLRTLLRRRAASLRAAPPACSAAAAAALSTAADDGPRIALAQPPDVLVEGCMERPVPVLFLPWESRGARHWERHMVYLAQRGVTAAAFDFREDGLRAMEAQVVAVVKELGFTPPVLVGRSLGAFIAQRYLQSHGASGAILVDPFPPAPMQMASHLARQALDCADADAARQLLSTSPARCEPALRAYFLERQWQEWDSSAANGDGDGGGDGGGDSGDVAYAFPVRALADMAEADAEVRLERGSVRMLVACTGMTDLAPDGVAMKTAQYHDAPCTWVEDDSGLTSTIYGWYDQNF